MRDRRYLLLIPIAALLAALPLILKGCSCGDDFGFHLLNWLEVGSHWKQGVFFPHWDFTAAGNSGEPRFVFYPPLSWMIGALSGTVLPWATVPNTFIWLSLTACGFTMYRLAREWASDGNALIAASFYMVHPYMLFTFYQRSAYAELLAAAWIPLVLLALLRPRFTIPGIALPVALLWLTNDPAAVMGCYLLALLAAVRAAWVYNKEKYLGDVLKEAIRIAIGTCLGLGLAGFYLVPAIVEQRWVQIRMENVKGTRIQDNFLFGNFGGPSHHAILRTASLCSVLLLILIALFAAIAIYRSAKGMKTAERGSHKFVITALLATTIIIEFLLIAPSYFIWRHIPELKYLQFPWRWDVILGAISASLLAIALGRIRIRPVAAISIALLIPLFFSIAGNSIFRQVCKLGKDVPDLVASYYAGDVLYSDEYTPMSSDPLAVGHDNPNAWMADVPDGAPPKDVPVKHSVDIRNRLHFQVSSPGLAFLVINVRDYPAWKVRINGTLDARRPHRVDGLIVAPIPEGKSQVDITYAVTPDQMVGWILSIAAFATLLTIWRTGRYRTKATTI
ncbi:MAG: hypothetical protein WA634_11935 [Silvibacterium sp.]